ncbi:MAG TPA: RNA-binding cell elongation regulator Jag/EloR [Fimbriimonas sp.]
MQTVEITAKSVDEASRLAAEKLGVPQSQVQVTVLEETKGLFGKSTVRIRAEAREPAAGKPAREAPPAPDEAPESPVEDIQEAFEAPAPATEAKKGRSPRKPKAAPEKSEEPAAQPEEASEAPEVVATEEDGERMSGLVREFLDAAGLQVSARVGERNGRYVSVVLDGKDAAFLVGKHGEVLNALQYLVNIIASRRLANGVRATLDCHDYRRRREEALTGLATKIAQEVKQRGEEAVLDALPAFERRVVHKALSEIEGVTTYSEGEEPNRRVVIAPG